MARGQKEENEGMQEPLALKGWDSIAGVSMRRLRIAPPNGLDPISPASASSMGA